MSIFTPVLDFLHDLFCTAGKTVADLALALAKSLADNGGEFLAATAIAAVAAAEANGGTGSDKFAAAKQTVVTALEGKA